jgi:hypothetical protein
MALSSPDSTSPALIGLPAFAGAGSACCAHAEGAATATAIIIAKQERLPNRRFVMSISSVYDG